MTGADLARAMEAVGFELRGETKNYKRYASGAGAILVPLNPSASDYVMTLTLAVMVLEGLVAKGEMAARALEAARKPA